MSANFAGTGRALIYLVDPAEGYLEASTYLGPGMHPVADYCALSNHYMGTVLALADYSEPSKLYKDYYPPRVPGVIKGGNLAANAEAIDAFSRQVAQQVIISEMAEPSVPGGVALNYKPPFSKNWRNLIPF